MTHILYDACGVSRFSAGYRKKPSCEAPQALRRQEETCIVTENEPESPVSLERGCMALPSVGLGLWGIRGIIPSQIGINRSPDYLCDGYSLLRGTPMQPFYLLFCQIDICSSHACSLLDVCHSLLYTQYSSEGEKGQEGC